MEQLYNDFVTSVLPTIKDGMVITKEYFMELAGRYIKYLIITDSIGLAMFMIIFIGTIVFAIKKHEWLMDYTDGFGYAIIFLVCFGAFVGIIDFGDNLIKDIYLPEVRIMQELKSITK